MRVIRIITGLATLSSILFLAGCEAGPKYVKATVPATPSYKEAPPESLQEAGQWKSAQPDDQALRGKWWTVFGDPQLDALEDQLTISNQDLKVADARLREATLRSWLETV